MNKFILALVLISILTAVSCAAEVTDNHVTQSGESVPEGVDFNVMTPGEQFAVVKEQLPSADYEGYEFKFLTRDSVVEEDLLAENITGEPINDAVYERNTFIEEKYNIQIVSIGGGGSEPSAAAMKHISSGDDAFDTISDGLSNLASKMITNVALTDVHTVDGLQTEKPWWDKKLIEGFDLKSKAYLLTGDISITDDYFTMSLLFNKDIVRDYSLGDIYAMIADGSWTIDKMYDMTKVAAADLNGDGKLDLKDDRYGLLSERYGTYGFWAAAGQRITSKGDEDELEFSVYSDQSVNIFNKAFEFQRDFNVTWLNVVSGNYPYNEMLVTFGAGRALFYYGGLTNTMTLRASETDFGIITMPKFDEKQKDYYNSVSVWNCLAFGVPITNAGAVGSDRTGTVLDSMAAVSKYTLTPAYYEITLKGKLSRDNESEQMLDLLMSTRVYDLGTIFDWGGSFSIFYNMTNSGNADFASQWAAVEAKAKAALDEFNKLF